MDNRHARFRLKVAGDGCLLMDAVTAIGPLQTMINHTTQTARIPAIDVSILNQYSGGQMLTYDLLVNDSSILIEIEVLSDPGVPPEPAKLRKAI